MWRAKIEAVRAAPSYHLTLGNRDAGLGFDRLLGRALGAALTPTAVDAALADEARATVDRAAERKGLDVPDGVPLVVGMGQLIDRKGIDVAIDALAARTGAADRAALVRCRRRAGHARCGGPSERGVADQVELVDPDRFATRVDLFRAVAAADLYLQPSREEGLPLALVEAMALGVPVVATPVNGIPEVVEHDVTGLLVPVGDPAALATAIDAVLDDPLLRARLAHGAAARIEPEHDLAAVGATMGSLYRRALEHAAARRGTDRRHR